MKYTLISIISFLILIGTIGVCMNLALGNQTVTYLNKIRVDQSGFYMYTFDYASYFRNLQLSITDISDLELQIPTREWQWMTNIFNWEPLGNDLALILDYIILGLNALLYPLRIGAYLIRNLLAIIGINMNANQEYNGLGWLITVTNFLISVQIPYV